MHRTSKFAVVSIKTLSNRHSYRMSSELADHKRKSKMRCPHKAKEGRTASCVQDGTPCAVWLHNQWTILTNTPSNTLICLRRCPTSSFSVSPTHYMQTRSTEQSVIIWADTVVVEGAEDDRRCSPISADFCDVTSRLCYSEAVAEVAPSFITALNFSFSVDIGDQRRGSMMELMVMNKDLLISGSDHY